MNSTIERSDLTPVWVDVKEALDIMRGFENGDIKQSSAKESAKDGVRLLTRAHDTLGKMVDFPSGA